MKNIHSQNLVGIGSWGPEVWPDEYLISPIRGVGTATAGAALAAPLFSIKKKERKKEKKGKKVEKLSC